MDTLQVSGIAAFTLLSLAFYVARKMVLFNVSCLAVLGGFFLTNLYRKAEISPEFGVMTAGLFLYWFGLLIVRVMLQRSVSLHLLMSYFLQDPAETIQEEVSSRFRDALFFRLVNRTDETFSLTLFGRFIASIVALFYFIVRIER
jgi:hypothetical protein